MKNNLLPILAAVCLAGAQQCTAGDVKSLKSKLQQLVKPIITVNKPQTILTKRPDEAATKKLNSFLKSDFLKFIGSDDARREELAKALVNDFSNALGTITRVFNQLAVTLTRSEVPTLINQKGDYSSRREEQLNPNRAVKAIDPAGVPWGTSDRMTVDGLIGETRLQDLKDAKIHVTQVKTLVPNAGCKLKPCKDRFDLLLAGAEQLGMLIKAIEFSIDNLSRFEKKAIASQGGGYIVTR